MALSRTEARQRSTRRSMMSALLIFIVGILGAGLSWLYGGWSFFIIEGILITVIVIGYVRAEFHDRRRTIDR